MYQPELQNLDCPVAFIPMQQWVIEERALGQSTPQAIVSFKAALRDPRARTKVAHGAES